jgi:hypothetical protein
MRERLISMIPGFAVAALSWVLFWTLLVTELE